MPNANETSHSFTLGWMVRASYTHRCAHMHTIEPKNIQRYSQLKRFVSTFVGTKICNIRPIEDHESDGKMKITTTATTSTHTQTHTIMRCPLLCRRWTVVLMLLAIAFDDVAIDVLSVFLHILVVCRPFGRYASVREWTTESVCIKSSSACICIGHITLWFHYHNSIIAGRACIQFSDRFSSSYFIFFFAVVVVRFNWFSDSTVAEMMCLIKLLNLIVWRRHWKSPEERIMRQ